MARRLKLHGTYATDTRTSTIWVQHDDRVVSNTVSGRVRDVEDFFKRNQHLMLQTEPLDFSLWLVDAERTGSQVAALIADEPDAFRELGLIIEPDVSTS